jgi:hypothetical protein
VDDTELFLHIHRMSRLTRALKAPLDLWEEDILKRIRRRFGNEGIGSVRVQLDEAFIEMVTSIGQGIEN